MTTPTLVLEYWRDRIERDLSPFTDPGTELILRGEGRALRAQWTSRRTVCEASFAISIERGVTVSYEGRTTDYRAFLVGPTMADLPGLARMILQARKPELYVDTKARDPRPDSAKESSAVDMLKEVLREEDPNATKVVIVTGEAGAGKTRVLEELVRTQAHAFTRGQSTRLFLYINAQGRALARFNEALATELQDLRSLLTYHAVTTMTRLGALVPVIDGFDELLGVSGYDDAFSSLAGFIEELDGQGQIIASARSTYYEEEFVARASSVSSLGGQVWVQVPVTIKAWGESELNEYVKKKGRELGLTVDEVSYLVTSLDRVLSGTSAQLRQKPLFVARTLDLLLDGQELAEEEDLLSQLVDGFIEREQKEKLLDRTQQPLLTPKHLRDLMRELAEEMWNQETRELDRRSVREVAEYVMVLDELPERTQQIMFERMPTMAFLAPGERDGAVRFEHEVFFSYFLGQVLARKVLSDESALRMFLTRSVLPPDVGTNTVRVLEANENSAMPVESLTEIIAAAARTHGVRPNQVKENAGRLMEAVLTAAGTKNGGKLEGINIHEVIFPGGALRDITIAKSRLKNVVFRRTDLSRTRFLSCQSSDCWFYEVLVDPQYTRLELEGLQAFTQVVGLRAFGEGSTNTIYDPLTLKDLLVKCGALPASPEQTISRELAEAPLRLMDKLIRAYGRANPVCTADDNLRSLFLDPDWEALEELLVRHRIVTKEKRTTGGPPKTFLRRQFLPEQIMAGLTLDADVPRPVRQFWDAVEDWWDAGSS